MTPLALTEEQAALARQSVEVVGRHSPLADVRRRRASGEGFSRPLWAEARALGWTAIPFPEDAGGLGLGLAEMAAVLEAHGRCLAATPLLSSTMLGARALALGGPSPLLERAIGGAAIVVLGWTGRVSMLDGALHGSVTTVLDGAVADAFVVVTHEGVYQVYREAPGLAVLPLHRVDGHSAASLRFDGAPAVRLADRAALDPILDDATIALSAEMLGGMTACFERTVDWLKTRHQFGVPIGSFQALQHRAARLFVEIELCRSAVVAAARSEATERPMYASLAKARCNEVYLEVAGEAIQMHGGVGMTDEHDIGFFLKRARVASVTLGSTAWHRDRWARLAGY